MVPVRLIIGLGLVFGWVGLLIQGLRWTLVIGPALLLVGAVAGAPSRSHHGPRSDPYTPRCIRFVSQFLIVPDSGVAWAARGGFVFSVLVALVLRDRAPLGPPPVGAYHAS